MRWGSGCAGRTAAPADRLPAGASPAVRRGTPPCSQHAIDIRPDRGRADRPESGRCELGFPRPASPRGFPLSLSAGAFPRYRHFGHPDGRVPAPARPRVSAISTIRTVAATAPDPRASLPVLVAAIDGDDRAWRALVGRFDSLVTAATDRRRTRRAVPADQPEAGHSRGRHRADACSHVAQARGYRAGVRPGELTLTIDHNPAIRSVSVIPGPCPSRMYHSVPNE